MDEAKHNYLIKPLANTFTLGIYGMMKPSKVNGTTKASSSSESIEKAADQKSEK